MEAEEFKKDLAEEYRQAGQLFYLGGWVQSELKDIRQEIRDVRLELKSELKSVEVSLRQEIGALRKDMNELNSALRQEMKEENSALRREIGVNSELLLRKMDGLQRWVIAALFAMLLAVVGLNLAG